MIVRAIQICRFSKKRKHFWFARCEVDFPKKEEFFGEERSKKDEETIIQSKYLNVTHLDYLTIRKAKQVIPREYLGIL